MHFASIANKRQHLAVIGAVIHYNAKTAIVERSLTQEHISVKDSGIGQWQATRFWLSLSSRFKSCCLYYEY